MNSNFSPFFNFFALFSIFLNIILLLGLCRWILFWFHVNKMRNGLKLSRKKLNLCLLTQRNQKYEYNWWANKQSSNITWQFLFLLPSWCGSEAKIFFILFFLLQIRPLKVGVSDIFCQKRGLRGIRNELEKNGQGKLGSKYPGNYGSGLEFCSVQERHIKKWFNLQSPISSLIP